MFGLSQQKSVTLDIKKNHPDPIDLSHQPPKSLRNLSHHFSTTKNSLVSTKELLVPTTKKLFQPQKVVPRPPPLKKNLGDWWFGVATRVGGILNLSQVLMIFFYYLKEKKKLLKILTKSSFVEIDTQSVNIKKVY